MAECTHEGTIERDIDITPELVTVTDECTLCGYKQIRTYKLNSEKEMGGTNG